MQFVKIYCVCEMIVTTIYGHVSLVTLPLITRVAGCIRIRDARCSVSSTVPLRPPNYPSTACHLTLPLAQDVISPLTHAQVVSICRQSVGLLSPPTVLLIEPSARYPYSSHILLRVSLLTIGE